MPKQHRPITAKIKRHAKAPPTGTPRLMGDNRRKRNARLFRRNPLCVECLKRGVIMEAEEWDHIVPLSEGGAEHESNLQGLCRSCHAEKSARENVARAKRRSGE